MAIGLLKDLKLIQERVWGATARFKYTDEDGLPWHNEKEPRILVLGIYTDPNTGNRNVAGIDLKDVVSRYGMEGLNDLRQNLPHILFTDFEGADQGESLSDVAMNAAIENAFVDGNVITEVSARPLKGADAGAPGTIGRWRYGFQDKDLSHIFDNSYRTYRMDRMGPATQSKLYAIEKSDKEKLAQAYKEIDKVEKEWQAMGKQEKLQVLAAKADKGKATPEKAIGKEPEPEVVEPEISKPPAEPEVAPTADELPGLKISPKKYKRDIEIPLPGEEPEEPKEVPEQFETSAEEETLGGIQQVDDEEMRDLAKIQVAKAQEQNAESPIAKRRKAVLKAKLEKPEELEEPKKKPDILKAKPKPKAKEDEIIELD